MIEYAPWYGTGQKILKCSECRALVMEGDTDKHTEWHEKIQFAPILQTPST